MLQVILPVVLSVIDAFKNNQQQIAKDVGVSSEVVDKVGKAVGSYLSKDERLLRLADQHMQDARQHAVHTQVTDIWLVNLMRGLVRPMITFTAFGWYIYARYHGIELPAEDYALIGGILAFWFGFRPFEKKQR